MIIEGFFSNMKTANDTVKELKSKGFSNSHFDINDPLRDDRNVTRNIAGTETGESLSDLVLESGSTSFIDRTKAPLAAANPSVSGMGPMEEITDINCKVVVNVDNNDIEKVKNIMEAMGGEFDNPFIEEPKIVVDEDKVFDISMDRLRRNL